MFIRLYAVEILSKEPQLFRSLWDTISDLMHDIELALKSSKFPQRAEVECAVYGMLLLNSESVRRQMSFSLSEDSLDLMVNFALELRDCEMRQGCAGGQSALSSLILVLVKHSADRLSKAQTESQHADGNTHSRYSNILLNLDLLLDATRNGLILMVRTSSIYCARVDSRNAALTNISAINDLLLG